MKKENTTTIQPDVMPGLAVISQLQLKTSSPDLMPEQAASLILTPEQIARLVLAYFKLEPAAVFRACRLRKIARPRQIAVWVILRQYRLENNTPAGQSAVARQVQEMSNFRLSWGHDMIHYIDKIVTGEMETCPDFRQMMYTIQRQTFGEVRFTVTPLSFKEQAQEVFG